jgi:lipoate-protein ligase A
MAVNWQVLDTGLLGAAENMAYDRALLEAREAGEIGNTLRFLRFTPSALVGCHQSLEQELDLDYCAAHGVEVQRRITGGGAIYFDPGQLGWELFLPREVFPTADREEVARHVCEAAAAGIRSLGVDARFRPRNDIEVAGRKISGTGGTWEGRSLMYQGTLLLDFDVERMLRVLRIPAEKLRDKAVASVRERVVSLRELVGEVPPLEQVQAALAGAFGAAFGVGFTVAELPAVVETRYRAALAEISSDEWRNLVAKPFSEAPLLEAVGKFPGGLLRVAAAYDRRTRLIKQLWFSGDFFAQPARLVNDLEARLKNVTLLEAETTIRRFLGAYPPDALSLSADELILVLRQALDENL